MQHVSHFLPTYVDYHLKRAAQIKGKRDNGACCPESPPPNVPLRAPQVRTYQTHKCLGFGGLLGPPVWRHETCGSRAGRKQSPTRSKPVEDGRSVEERRGSHQIWKGPSGGNTGKHLPGAILTARFRGDGRVFAFRPSQLKPLNHLQKQCVRVRWPPYINISLASPGFSPVLLDIRYSVFQVPQSLGRILPAGQIRTRFHLRSASTPLPS